MPHCFTRFCLVAACCLFAACGGQNGGLALLAPEPDNTDPSPYVTEDPLGPIPEPSLPPDLAAASDSRPGIAAPPPAQPSAKPGSEETPSGAQGENATENPLRNVSYSVTVVTPDAPELEAAFLAASLLEQMREKPPASPMGLEQRMRSDLETALNVLHSSGYYAGKARGDIVEERSGARPETRDAETAPSGRYTVVITFEPGPRYTIGKTRVSVVDPEQLRPDPTKGEYSLPGTTLAAVGLNEGSPALAGAVLDAVSAMREHFRDRGYPFASIASSRYIVDHAAQTLDAEIVMDSGPLVYMDGLALKGEPLVDKSYLEALSTWRPGQPWNQSQVETYRNVLRQSGLFAAAELTPAETPDENGLRSVVAELTPAPFHTLGGAVKYDTDFGPGVQAYWEHRNVTGHGDKLRIEMPLWTDLQELVATYRLPFFLRDDQDFTARAAYRNEDTDAYKLTAYLAAAGVERRISPHWTGGLELYLEGGELADPDEPKTEYLLMGVPATLSYNNADSLLDATKGFRLNLSVAPYTGEFHKEFTVVRSRIDAQAFLPIIGDNALVLALRGMYGMVSDANAQDVPASLRFYTGGGGSVRGYAYQSLGPRNDSRDPLGGASAVEVSAEARARFTETWGMVAFLDGGMAYEDATANLSKEELRWGAGLGVRFYTAIGPIRLDFAVPLNKRADDDSFQVYFSIGQSF